MNKYSVLMSIYKKELPDRLQLSIESMLAQTIQPDQIVLVKDGELTPELNAVISYYESTYPDIFTVVSYNINRGLAYALNAGLAVCRNEMVARMDSDDYSLPNRCAKQLNSFDADMDLVLVGTMTKNFVGDISNVSDTIKYRPTTYEEIKKYIRREDPFAHPSVMYKKTAVLSCGGYDSELRRRQDYDLFSKMVNKGYKAINLPEVLLLFRADENYLGRNKNKESCKARIIVQKRLYMRGECSFFDFAYIWIGMKISYLMPAPLYKKLYDIVKIRKR